jgi:hypothetical protein
MPNKKTNALVSDIIFPIIAIGGLIIGIIFSDKLTFIPDISFCTSKPIFLCDVPILSKIVRILDTRFIAGMLIYAGIFLLGFFLLRLLGFNVLEEDENNKPKKPETIKEKQATQKFQIYVLLITFFVLIIWLIFFDK